MSHFRRALSRPWLVGAIILAAGAFTVPAAQSIRAIGGLPGSSRAAGSSYPLDVILLNADGTPAELAATITGDVTIDTSALETLDGALTETAPASDTASSGLNGRLQRIAQRLTALIAKTPALGTAGTASSDVITVQGIASMTPLLATLSGTNNIATVTTVSAVTAITNALPAGTNAIGKLAANSGVDIGDVDVTTVGTITPGTAASSLGKLEDAAAASGDTGIAIWTKRTDSAASSAGTDGDYATLNTDASGRLWVICGSGCSGGTQFAEDAAHSSGDSGTLSLAVRRDSAASGTSADGDYASLNVDASGRLWVICGSGCSGGTQFTEDTAHQTGDAGTVGLAVRGDSPGNLSSTTGDYEPLQVAAGLLWARVRGLQTPNGDSVLDDTADAVKTTIVDAAGAAITAGIDCDASVKIDTASSGSTQLVALGSGETIYICGYNFMAGGTTTVKLTYGTGSACGTGTTDITGAYPLIAQTGVAFGNGSGYVAKGAASNAVCISLGSAVQTSGILSYTKF